MSKTPLTYSSENVLRSSSTNNNQSLLRRTSKEVKSNDVKSPLKSTTTTPKNAIISPIQYQPKKGYAWMHLKNTSERASNLMMASVENFESKENCSFETKLLSSSKQDNKKSLITLATEKSLALALNKHGSSSQLKSPQTRSFVDNKAVELNKKASLPTNLKLTLEKICTKGGSSTHRAHLNSPVSEPASKIYGRDSEVQKKSGRASGAESKGKASLEGSSSRSNSHAKYKLNTLLVGLSGLSTDQNKKSGKAGYRNVNSVNVTPRGHNQVYSIEEKTEALKKYNKLLGILKEKNVEIKKLSQDKNELKSTLGCVVEELKTLRDSQGSREKEASFGDTKNDPGSLQRHESLKAQSHNPSAIQSVHLYRKNTNTGENKASKALSTSLSTFKPAKSFSDRSGKSWMAAVNNKTTTSSKQKNERENVEDSYFKGTADNSEQRENANKMSSKPYVSSFYKSNTLKEGAEKKEREATSVDEITLRRGSHVDIDKRKASLQEGLDIGGALNELKNRIARLLTNKNNGDSSKTKLLYQSLQEHFQKVA